MTSESPTRFPRPAAAPVFAMLALALALARGPARATEPIAGQTGFACEVCHVEPDAERLNDRGLYYQELRTLDGYDELTAVFGDCTACHRSKPGSPKLTRQGKRFRDVVEDMEALRKWLRRMHPAARESAALRATPAQEPADDL